MKRNCPKKSCHSDQIIKSGSYYRRGDSRTIQRFQCRECGTKFSSSTGTLEYRQRKRRINQLLLKLFCSKVTQKRAALIARVNHKTVARRFRYWAEKAKLKNQKFYAKLTHDKVTDLQFDDLITKEKTKLKPLSVTVAVDVKRRYILAANVSQIASFGHLSHLSKKKYGKRSSEHKEKLEQTFKSLQKLVSPCAFIKSDEHKNYAPIVKKYFPKARYHQYKGIEGCVAGQGELKKAKYDPLFEINHTLAMMRDGLASFVRRTWCTTQCPKRLQGSLEMFIYFYNQIYLPSKNTT